MALLDEIEEQQEKAKQGASGGRKNALAQPGGGGRKGETVKYVNDGDSD